MKKRSLKTQMIVGIFLFAVVPLLIVGIISFRVMERALLAEGEDYSEKLMNGLTDAIDGYIMDMVNLSILPMYDMDVRSVVENNGNYYISDNYSQMYGNEKLNNFMFMLNNLRTEIDGVFIYCSDGRVYQNIAGKGAIGQYNYNNSYDYKNGNWYGRAKKQNGKSVIIAPRLQEQVLPGDKTVLSVGRVMRNLNTGRETGAILIDVNFTQIERLCQNLVYGEDEYVAITDENGRLIYSTISQTEKEFEYHKFLNRVGDGRSAYCTIDGKKYLVTLGHQGYTAWKTMRIVAVDRLLLSENRMRDGFILIFVICSILEIIIISMASKRITVPIKTLCYKMSLVERGDLDVRVDVVDSTEIGMLGNSFNVMVERLNDSLHKTYQVELEKKQAQLIALQSQINPHFLYNTLDSIHMMAELNCDYEVGVMVTSLAKMMRYSIGTGGFEGGVRICDEAEYVVNYMELQKLRLEHKVDLEIHIPECVKDCVVPKLILQPIVENSVIHGLKGLYRTCIVKLDVRHADQDVVLRIADNGAGMSTERLAFVRASLECPEKEVQHKSIGLRNVHNRIRFRFGENHGVKIISSNQEGTVVEVRIPAETGNSGEDYV